MVLIALYTFDPIGEPSPAFTSWIDFSAAYIGSWVDLTLTSIGLLLFMKNCEYWIPLAKYHLEKWRS